MNTVLERSDLITVDRAVVPHLPDFVRAWEYPLLQAHGPKEFRVDNIYLGLFPGQKTMAFKGRAIWQFLDANKMIPKCFSLRDLEETRKKGIVFFRKHFKGKILVAYKSVARSHRKGSPSRVPFLCECGGRLIIDWDYLRSVFPPNALAACFKD